MGFFTTVALAGATAGSALMQGMAASSEAKAEAKQMKQAAGIAERDAIARKEKTTFDQVRHVQEGERKVSSVKAAGGASGAIVSEGAPSELTSEQVFENELQNALIGYAGQTEVAGMESATANYRTGVKYAMARASNAKITGALGAAQSLLGTVGTMKEYGMGSGSSTDKKPKRVKPLGPGGQGYGSYGLHA